MIMYILDKLHDYTLNALALLLIPFFIFIFTRKLEIKYKDVAIKINSTET
jgi:hypothetical protein